MENDHKRELYMIGYVAGASSDASSNVSVRIARNESTSSNDQNGSYLCTSQVKSDAGFEFFMRFYPQIMYPYL
jgi:hypothetical protein